MGRIWRAAGTVNSVLESRLEPQFIEKAAAAGLPSLFVGFETVNVGNPGAAKISDLNRDYGEAIKRLHGVGIMINGSFVFGMVGDNPDVFDLPGQLRVDGTAAPFHPMPPARRNSSPCGTF